jgi:hypothetical protein
MAPAAQLLFEQAWPDGDYRFFQLGFVVDDVVGAAMRWSAAFGVGPFSVLPRRTTTVTYRGAEIEQETQLATTQAGPVQIELIQPVSAGPNIFRDLYPPGAGGFHQVCTIARDFEAKVTHFEALGYELAGSIDARGHRVAYVDTVADFGFFTEVVAHRDDFLARLAADARECAQWDGTDPVRLLTRDGYRTP